MGPLAGQKRPGPTLAPALVRPAVRPLAVAIMIVPPPAGPKRGVDFKDCINHLERIFNQWTTGLVDPVPDELQESGIHDLLGGKFKSLPGRPIVEDQTPGIGILQGLLIVGDLLALRFEFLDATPQVERGALLFRLTPNAF